MAKRVDFHVRLSEDERAALQEKASSFGMTSSAYVRFCASLPIELVDGALAGDPGAPVLVDATTYRRLLVEARRWGSNFNQATRALNTIGRRYANPPRGAERADEVVRLAARAMESMGLAKAGMDELVRAAGALEARAAARASLPEGR